jgi:glutathione S-transferase
MASTRLYLLHGSHPCATVDRALELKGVPFSRIEVPVGTQPLVMRAMFGGPTVPAVRFADGAKVQGSSAILRELDRRVPDPALFGAPEIDEAERWGEAVLQPLPRRLLWAAFSAAPEAMYDYQQGQRSPKVPRAAIAAVAKVLLPVERRINDVSDAGVRADLAALPAALDHVDALLADGVLGGDRPNGADLQIAPTVRLLLTIEDLRPLIAGRPAAEHAHRWFAPLPGSVPAGALPAAQAMAAVG